MSSRDRVTPAISPDIPSGLFFFYGSKRLLLHILHVRLEIAVVAVVVLDGGTRPHNMVLEDLRGKR